MRRESLATAVVSSSDSVVSQKTSYDAAPATVAAAAPATVAAADEVAGLTDHETLMAMPFTVVIFGATGDLAKKKLVTDLQ